MLGRKKTTPITKIEELEDIIDDTNNQQTIQGLYDFSPSPKA
jgi:hypothetical protein